MRPHTLKHLVLPTKVIIFLISAFRGTFVNIPEDVQSTDDALEYAYRWTNNVMGSWSRTDIEDNGDYNPNVTLMASLGEGGMGLRSTSMGDQMLIGNKKYTVAAFGFEEI